MLLLENRMSEQTMQGIEAVAEIGQPLAEIVTDSKPQSLETALAEAAVSSFSPSEELVEGEINSTSKESLRSDLKQLEQLAVSAAAEAIADAQSQTVQERPNYDFVGRESTNMIVHRRANPDSHYVFDIVDSVGGTWYNKKDDVVTSEAAGVDASHTLVMALAEETVNFFSVIDIESTGEKQQDQGDITNLSKLRSFAQALPNENLVHNVAVLLMSGFRSINIGDRLIQKAMAANTEEVSGTITIGYQIHGQQGVHKYRLVGDIKRELILGIAAIGGTVVSEVLNKQKPKSNKPKAAIEQSVNNTPRSDVGTGGAQLSRRLIEINEALIVDHRKLQQTVNSQSATIDSLQKDIKKLTTIVKQLTDSNDAILKSVSQVAKTLLDR
jgi:hypothetical protein